MLDKLMRKNPGKIKITLIWAKYPVAIKVSSKRKLKKKKKEKRLLSYR
jgi:hypothetical protein